MCWFVLPCRFEGRGGGVTFSVIKMFVLEFIKKLIKIVHLIEFEVSLQSGKTQKK